MSRYGFVLRRLLSLIPLGLGILLVLMLLLNLMPGNPARLVAGPRASQASVNAIGHQLGLDLPIWHRYLNYVGHVLTGDLGTSFKTGQSVRGQIADQLPVTLSLAVAGVVLALLISVPLAVWAARRPDGLVDHAVRVLGILGIGLPTFWVAIMAIRLIALPSGWFPVAGFGNGLAEHLRALILPGLVLAVSLSAPMIRSLRSTMIELERAEFVAAGQSLGFGGLSLLGRFKLRNAIGPLINVTAAQASFALFGTVVLEVAFGMPGLGLGLVTAASTRDFPLVQGDTLVFAVLMVLLYLLSDVMTAVVDPRVRISA